MQITTHCILAKSIEVYKNMRRSAKLLRQIDNILNFVNNSLVCLYKLKVLKID